MNNFSVSIVETSTKSHQYKETLKFGPNFNLGLFETLNNPNGLNSDFRGPANFRIGSVTSSPWYTTLVMGNLPLKTGGHVVGLRCFRMLLLYLYSTIHCSEISFTGSNQNPHLALFNFFMESIEKLGFNSFKMI